jgi:GNAT superfamily N-acetyltransferase
MGQPLLLRRATEDQHADVLELIHSAEEWLRSTGTDQWKAPWPDENGRNERILRAIEAGRTWIAWDGDWPAATLTASPNHHRIWPEAAGRDPAVYVRRLTIRRKYSGLGLGGQLLDWAGLHASRDYGARWIRVDVWTTNTGLHEYYRDQGFRFCDYSPISGYPSAALFQKPIDQITPAQAPLFQVDPEDR